MEKIVYVIMGFLLLSCKNNDDGFRSKVLLSSKGERLYINTYNYGMTGDHQITIISKDKDKLRYSRDTLGTVAGLEPFVYSFEKDTLTLVFNGTITYKVKDTFETIKISYDKVPNPKYMDYMQKAVNNDGFHCVPNRNAESDPSIPKPSTNNDD